MNLTDARPLLGILVGAVLGGAAYGISRALLPGQLAMGAALVGVSAGLGARLARAIGTPAQLRVMVFASLFVLVFSEYAVYSFDALGADLDGFVVHLFADGVWLLFTILFLVGGIFLGVRLLVGGDPLAQIAAHAGGALPLGASGTQCPRCDSHQTLRDLRSHELDCAQCGHRFRIT